MIGKLKIVLFILMGILLFSQCKKDEEDWVFCIDCDLNSWVGNYEGSGVYYSDIDGKTDFDVQTNITVENISGTILKTTVTAGDYFTSSTTASKDNSDYFFEVPGSNGSLSLTLSKKGNEYKLTGTSKQYHYQSDTLFTDHSISFDVFKNQK